MSLFERKSPPHESKSSFYIDVDEAAKSGVHGNADVSADSVPTLSVTSDNVVNGSLPNSDVGGGLSSHTSDRIDSNTPGKEHSSSISI